MENKLLFNNSLSLFVFNSFDSLLALLPAMMNQQFKELRPLPLLPRPTGLSHVCHIFIFVYVPS